MNSTGRKRYRVFFQTLTGLCITATLAVVSPPAPARGGPQLPPVPNPSSGSWGPVTPPIVTGGWGWTGTSSTMFFGTVCFSAPGASIACNNPPSAPITITQGTMLSAGITAGPATINAGKSFSTSQTFTLNGQPCKNCELFICYPNAALFEYVNVRTYPWNSTWFSYSLVPGGTPAANTKCVDARAWCCNLGHQECCDEMTECPVDAEGDCTAPHETPGCEDTDCCTSVCPLDPFCCQAAWDPICADLAVETCNPPDQPFEEQWGPVLVIDLGQNYPDDPNVSLDSLTPVQQCELQQIVTMHALNAPHGSYSELVVFDTDETMHVIDLTDGNDLFGASTEDNFDTFYAPNVQIHGVNGWKGWGNDPAFSAPVTDVQSHSPDLSVEIAGQADLVHELCTGADGGAWSYSAWQYVPSDFASGGSDVFDGTYFILLNTYQDGGPHEPEHWSVQVQFDSNDGLMKTFHGEGTDTINVPYETDRWVKIQTIIDLDEDWTRIYYDDAIITEYPWTGGILGEGGGAPGIAAVDLFANGSSPVYYDDLRLEPITSECGNDLNIDADGDELTLLEEFLLGTNPCNPDTDGDNMPDGFDNCPLTFNPDQQDSNGNGIGDACDEPLPGDLNGDHVVNVNDLLLLLGEWGACQDCNQCPADLNDDCTVNVSDLLQLLANWG